MVERYFVIAFAISYLLDKHVDRQVKLAEAEKIKQETKKLALEIEKASK